MSEANLTVGGHSALETREAPAFAIPHKKLVMWLFIISDAVTFGAILFAYGYLHNATPDWPRPFESASVINAYVMTFILVTSSLTMLIAIRAAKEGNKSKAIAWSFITVVGGLIYALLHIKEWMGLIGGGPTFLGTLVGQAWVSPALATAFFAVAAGSILYVVIQLLAVAGRSARRDLIYAGVLVGLLAGFLTDAIVTAAGV